MKRVTARQTAGALLENVRRNFQLLFQLPGGDRQYYFGSYALPSQALLTLASLATECALRYE